MAYFIFLIKVRYYTEHNKIWTTSKPLELQIWCFKICKKTGIESNPNPNLGHISWASRPTGPFLAPNENRGGGNNSESAVGAEGTIVLLSMRHVDRCRRWTPIPNPSYAGGENSGRRPWHGSARAMASPYCANQARYELNETTMELPK
jgi:hypothetical protein